MTLYGEEMGTDSLGHKGKVEFTAESTVDSAVEPIGESPIELTAQLPQARNLYCGALGRWVRH